MGVDECSYVYYTTYQTEYSLKTQKGYLIIAQWRYIILFKNSESINLRY